PRSRLRGPRRKRQARTQVRGPERGSRSLTPSPQGLQESVEEAGGVVRAGGGLGVVLDGEDRLAGDLEALDRAVVQVDLSHPAGGGERGGVDREAVVLAGDQNLPRRQVLNRLVAAMMAEAQLVGRAAQGEPQELVAEADAEERGARAGQLADG